MSDTSRAVMSARQAAELDHALARNGWSAAEVKQLCAGHLLAQLRPVLRGTAFITTLGHIIDCDANPFDTFAKDDGWSVESHRPHGLWKWDPARVSLYCASEKRHGKNIFTGGSMWRELKKKTTLNSNVLSYLLVNQHLIPEEWKKDERGWTRNIFFWGTMFNRPDGSSCSRYLCWEGNRWRTGEGYLGCDLDGENFVPLHV